MTHGNRSVIAGQAFSNAADCGEVQPTKKKTTNTVSLRLSETERARLKRDAGPLSQSAYIRDRLFGDDAVPRRMRARTPVKDHAALARVLDALGRSGLADDFGDLSWSVDEGVVRMGADTEHAIKQACTDIADMRANLMTALGLRLDQPR